MIDKIHFFEHKFKMIEQNFGPARPLDGPAAGVLGQGLPVAPFREEAFVPLMRKRPTLRQDPSTGL